MAKLLLKDIHCPLHRTLSIVGERWTGLILRELVRKGPRKYYELSEVLEGISPNLLSSRLKTLMKHQIVQKELYSEHPPRYVYSLTSRGRSLKPVLETLKNWGKAHTRYK